MSEVRPLVWMRAVRDAAPKFKPARLAVLWALGLRMGAEGAGYASARQLAGDAQVSDDTAQRATTDARERGYLNRTRRGHRLGNGAVVASEWQLTVPSQTRTGAALNEISNPQSDNLKPAETPSQTRTGAAPRGLLQEVNLQEAADGAAQRPTGAQPAACARCRGRGLVVVAPGCVERCPNCAPTEAVA